MLTPGFGGPNGPTFPSNTVITHAGSTFGVEGPSLCCRGRVDEAAPGGDGADLGGEDIGSTL